MEDVAYHTNKDKRSTLRVAVVGGGVAGIVAAYALASESAQCSSTSLNVDIDVYEAASKFGEIGAGIGVTWRAWIILTMLGLRDDLVRLVPKAPTDEVVVASRCKKSDQDPGVHLLDLMTRGGYTTFLRTEFHATIFSRLANFPHCHTHTSKRLLSYVEIERNGVPEITLDFSDGTTATCDVLIGADGLRSPVRCSMYESLAHHAELVGCKCRNDEDKDRGEALKSLQRPKWSGVLVYRALVPTKELLNVNTDHPVASRVMQYFGRNQHITSYPVSSNRFINIVIFMVDYTREFTYYPEPWMEMDVDPGPVIDAFTHWEKEVRDLVGCIKLTKVSRWSVNVVTDLPTFTSYSGRVVLLGDAAHAMTPFQGVGAGQAIEDAYILSKLLLHPMIHAPLSFDTETCPSNGSTSMRVQLMDRIRMALQVYSDVRLPFTREVQKKSRIAGMQHAFHPSVLQMAQDNQGRGDGPQDHDTDGYSKLDLAQLAEDIQSGIDWVSEGHPSIEVEKAVAMLVDRIERGDASDHELYADHAMS